MNVSLENKRIKFYDPNARGYAPRVPQSTWDKHKDELAALHQEGRSRKYMLEVLSQKRNFNPTIQQLNKQMTRWGLTANTVRIDNDAMAVEDAGNLSSDNDAMEVEDTGNMSSNIAMDLEDDTSDQLLTVSSERRRLEKLTDDDHDLVALHDLQENWLSTALVTSAEESFQLQNDDIHPTPSLTPLKMLFDRLWLRVPDHRVGWCKCSFERTGWTNKTDLAVALALINHLFIIKAHFPLLTVYDEELSILHEDLSCYGLIVPLVSTGQIFTTMNLLLQSRSWGTWNTTPDVPDNIWPCIDEPTFAVFMFIHIYNGCLVTDVDAPLNSKQCINLEKSWILERSQLITVIVRLILRELTPELFHLLHRGSVSIGICIARVIRRLVQNERDTMKAIEQLALPLWSKLASSSGQVSESKMISTSASRFSTMHLEKHITSLVPHMYEAYSGHTSIPSFQRRRRKKSVSFSVSALPFEDESAHCSSSSIDSCATEFSASPPEDESMHILSLLDDSREEQQQHQSAVSVKSYGSGDTSNFYHLARRISRRQKNDCNASVYTHASMKTTSTRESWRFETVTGFPKAPPAFDIDAEREEMGESARFDDRLGSLTRKRRSVWARRSKK